MPKITLKLLQEKKKCERVYHKVLKSNFASGKWNRVREEKDRERYKRFHFYIILIISQASVNF